MGWNGMEWKGREKGGLWGGKAPGGNKIHPKNKVQDEKPPKRPICPIEQRRIQRVQRMPIEPNRDTDPAAENNDSDRSYRDESPSATVTDTFVVEQKPDPDGADDLHEV